MKKVWLSIKQAASSSWEAIKKLPGWAVLALLLLLALCWWLVKRATLLKKTAEVAKKIVATETKRDEQVNTAKKIHSEAGDKIKAKFNADIEKLEEERLDLEKEMSKGPAAIANEWKEYLEGLK